MNVIPNSPEARDVANILHAYTNLSAHNENGPMIITEGKGVFVKDNNGKEYIEGLAGLWCASFGFGEEELVKAATEQLQKLPYYHSFASKSMNPAIDLAEKLIQNAPGDFSKVYFASSGSEANDTMVKFLWYFNNMEGRPEKKKIISRLRGYHGVTVASGSLTGLPYAQSGFDLPLDFVRHTDTPHYYREALEGESEEEFSARLAANLEKLILEEGPDTIAGFIAEPVMGAGGVVPPPAGYFAKIREVLHKYDIFLIADEVICGFGRTGNMWGSQTYDVQPDIVTCAKALSSAYMPISAVMIKDRMYQTFVKHSDKLGIFGHGHTYSAHPVCTAVALRTQQLMEERDIIGHVRNMSTTFMKRINEFSEHPLIGESRGVGLLGGVEIVADKKSKQHFDPSAKIPARVAQLVQDEGLIVRVVPTDSVGFCPPLIINEGEINEMFDRFGRALNRLHDDLKKDGFIS